MRVRTIYGVDFSGAAEAGRNAWIADCVPMGRAKRSPLRVRSLASLESLAGASERGVALPWLVDSIRTSRDALWGIDFPFGLPVELGWDDWPTQLRAVSTWTESANAFGRHCCDRGLSATRHLPTPMMHVRRDTDRETRTPFDCYHYRIIYQTVHGMRDVLLPLREDPQTCVLPFDVATLDAAERVVVEACPGSTLRRLALPHNRYKQSKPGRVAVRYRRVRERILEGLASLVQLDDKQRRTIMNNPGGDALDAVLAAVGSWYAWNGFDAAAVQNHPRYKREGFIFC